MRFFFLIITFLATLTLQADEPQGISEFSKKVTEAVQTRDVVTLLQLSWETNVPQKIQDQNSASWEQLLSGDYPRKGSTFKNVEFFPLETFKNRKVTDEQKEGLSEEALKGIARGEQQAREIYENMTKPFLHGGQLYEYNLKVIGLLALNFTNGQAESGRMLPLGIDPAGNIRFALLQEAKTPSP